MPNSSAPAVVDGRRSSASTIAADMVTGSHELTISGYSGTKGIGIGTCIKSSAFTIGGHSWCIMYYPDGEQQESADWISLYLERLDKGKDDVTARFRLSLLDQAGEPVPSVDYLSEQRTFTSATRTLGYRKFVRRNGLESSSFLKGDSFRIRCHLTVVKIRAETARVQFHVPPSTDLHRHFGDLLDSKVGADVKFNVGRETFTAHRNVLAARSPVFKAQLFGWMKEKKAAQIRIDDIEPRVFRAMLHFIYTDSLPEIDEGDIRVMAQHLLVAADRYGLERLKLVCEDVLRNFIDTSTVATTLALAEQHGCHGLKEGCFKFLESPGIMKAVVAADGFDHLMSSCPSVVKELLGKVFP
ncbi:hypothetical protein SETIT_8G198100v2 [Setaria italica]|uniref:BTB domain-containing protein n=3 Tax=Setaria TaxID=4554 RepID=K3ZM69_SETIT|nr:BTB/POZ and MATH domain-containing protein 2 [Setaria italica]XP_034570024.1 BTB/POZ and MATH domain-containing protein 2-like [Setaria viridis]RCV39118.1 hypothetical protein SETIT_8G198100v2 [Setaria italica]TKW01846.1 hypothetical protein SEVIR_8G206200v2 [Setaria viridis]